MGRLPLAELGAARPARLARTQARRRAWSWRASNLGWRREARRALKRILRLRDRQLGPAGLTLVGVGQSDGVFRIEDALVGNDTELHRHPSSRSQQAGVSSVEFCRRQSSQISKRRVVCVREQSTGRQIEAGAHRLRTVGLRAFEGLGRRRSRGDEAPAHHPGLG